jgi:hypothetical protein
MEDRPFRLPPPVGFVSMESLEPRLPRPLHPVLNVPVIEFMMTLNRESEYLISPTSSYHH